MPDRRHFSVGTRSGALLLLALSGLAMSGCSLLAELDPPHEPVVEAPQLPPKPASDLPPPEVPDTVAREPGETSPEPEPEPDPPADVEPPRIAAVLTSRLRDYEDVAVALREELGPIDVYDLSDKSLTPKEIVESIRAAGSEVIVAIGYGAAIFAAGIERLPVVYTQVFNTAALDTASERIKGVSVLPPLDRQMAAWREVNPNLSSVGAIVGPGHEALIGEAERAAAAHGIRFRYELVQSDRETLYQFTRLVPEIDGYWLFPDNRVLSASVLRQMLSYASRHRVQVAVFNDSLLALGATLSTTSVDEDIARTVIDVANRMRDGDADEIPALSPLSDIDVRTSEATVAASDARPGAEGGR